MAKGALQFFLIWPQEKKMDLSFVLLQRFSGHRALMSQKFFV